MYGVQYNSIHGAIHEVVVSAWVQGIRLTTIPPYLMGDNELELNYGNAVFTKDLKPEPDGHWHHNYYYSPSKKMFDSNGNADEVSLFVRRV